MKQLLFILYFLLLNIGAFSQREYWGMTTYGGPRRGNLTIGEGVLFKIDRKGKNYQQMHNFDTATGYEPRGSLILAPNGKLYGFTTSGSSCSCYPSFLFQFDPITRVYTPILRTDTLPRQVSYSRGAPFLASNGKIYSLATNKLIETDPSTNISTVIADSLRPALGENYFMQASNGKVYFVTSGNNGIVGQFGALYELNLPTKTVIKRYQFVAGNGAAPYGSLVEWTTGVLYGTFSYGSGPITSTGGIFSYNLVTQTFEQKRTFYSVGVTGTAGCVYGGLTRYGNKLYGATAYEGVDNKGFIYRYDPATNALDILLDFGPLVYQNYYDSLHQQTIDIGRGWGTELISGYDGLLYGLSGGAPFAFDTATNRVYSYVALDNNWGAYPTYARLLETCFKPYFFNTLPDTLHAIFGQPFRFGLGTPNTDTFRWYKSNVLLPQQTDSLLYLASASLSDQGYYKCRMINECGDSITKQFYLKVDVVTPLGLVFTGRVNNRSALLQWTDLSAAEADTYTLQRSTDGRSFASVYITRAKPDHQEYRYTDDAFEMFANTNNGKAYYRLLQQNKDGKISYSSVVALFTDQSDYFTVTPNPADDKAVIRFGKTIIGLIQFDLMDENGKTIKSEHAKNVNIYSFQFGDVPSGMYIIKVTTPDGIYYRKIVIR